MRLKRYPLIFSLIALVLINAMGVAAFAENLKTLPQSEFKITAPAPYGLVMGQATCQDVRRTFYMSRGITNNERHSIVIVAPKGQPLVGVTQLVFHCDQHEFIDSVFIELDATRFEDIYTMLSDKYTVKEKNFSTIGKQDVNFVMGEYEIRISLPPRSSIMQLVYIKKSLFDETQKTLQQKAQIDRESQKSQL